MYFLGRTTLFASSEALSRLLGTNRSRHWFHKRVLESNFKETNLDVSEKAFSIQRAKIGDKKHMRRVWLVYQPSVE
jgi:hypothetical protein